MTPIKLFPWLFIFLLAPACAPPAPLPKAEPFPQNVVVLTDTMRWTSAALQSFKDSLQTLGYRVLISGYPAETPTSLTERLPWLLQPGVDLFLYDERLAGQEGFDSLKNALDRSRHPALVQQLD